MCRAIFRVWNTSCDTVPGRASHWSGSPYGVVQMAASRKFATCSPDTRRPTGSARDAGESPRDRGPAASSSSHRLSSSTGSRIWSRCRGSTGTGITGCSPRITSSGPPSRHSPSGMSASDEMPRPMGMRSADMRRAEMPPATAATHATSRGPMTPPGSPGRSSWPGWARSFHSNARGVVAASGSSYSSPIRARSGRSSRTSANRSNRCLSLPAVARRPTGGTSFRSTTTGQTFRRRPTSYPTSISTASDRISCHGADGP